MFLPCHVFSPHCFCYAAAYNHHYTGYVNSKSAKLVKSRPANPALAGHTADSQGMVSSFQDPNDSTKVASALLHEGNGGEFRLSYHGFPKGFAQFVDSPATFVMSPMQIDTWNRYALIPTTFQRAFLPFRFRF